MRLDERFNVKGTQMVEVRTYPSVRIGDWLALGMELEFYALGGGDNRHFNIHMTREEAFSLALEILEKIQSERR